MTFNIVGYTSTGTSREFIEGVDTIKEIRMLWDAYTDLYRIGRLHEEIIRLRASYRDSTGRTIDITNVMMNKEATFP